MGLKLREFTFGDGVEEERERVDLKRVTEVENKNLDLLLNCRRFGFGGLKALTLSYQIDLYL